MPRGDGWDKGELGLPTAPNLNRSCCAGLSALRGTHCSPVVVRHAPAGPHHQQDVDAHHAGDREDHRGEQGAQDPPGQGGLPGGARASSGHVLAGTPGRQAPCPGPHRPR